MRVFNAISCRRNVIFHLHNDILNKEKPMYLCKKIIDECLTVLCVSDYIANRMKTVKDKDNIKTLYNCIDFKHFDTSLIKKENILQIKKKYKIKNSDFVFIYTGRIVEEKGILELVKAFKRIKKKYSNTKLLIIGQDISKDMKTPFQKELYLESEDLLEDIIYIGNVNHFNIPTFLSIADCVVIPSKWEEPFGIVAIEAMAMKKAIIATKSGGLKEVLNNKCASLINKEYLIEELYNEMSHIYSNEKYRKLIAEKGYERVKSIKSFDEKYYFRNFLEISGIIKDQEILSKLQN
jgi:glycosyltransferase involved in cell wall biosynthesis